MKIIDAHLHFFLDEERFREIAKAAGGQATLSYLTEEMKKNQVVLGIGMGTVPTHDVDENPLELPFAKEAWPSVFTECLGVRATTIHKENRYRTIKRFERELARPEVVGFKIYAGYQPYYVNDPVYHPFYELAEEYDVPVVIHTGDTANSAGLLKYSHPLTVDEVAVNFPRVQFVMAHYGNPWLVDATEVLVKNPNVFADLSGLAQGVFNVNEFTQTYRAYLDQFAMWHTYLSRYDKLMYGSDWPLVNMENYIALLRDMIPQAHHQDVFFANALRIFKRLQKHPLLQNP